VGKRLRARDAEQRGPIRQADAGKTVAGFIQTGAASMAVAAIFDRSAKSIIKTYGLIAFSVDRREYS
jgi:hypothetical protein